MAGHIVWKTTSFMHGTPPFTSAQMDSEAEGIVMLDTDCANAATRVLAHT